MDAKAGNTASKEESYTPGERLLPSETKYMRHIARAIVQTLPRRDQQRPRWWLRFSQHTNHNHEPKPAVPCPLTDPTAIRPAIIPT